MAQARKYQVGVIFTDPAYTRDNPHSGRYYWIGVSAEGTNDQVIKWAMSHVQEMCGIDHEIKMIVLDPDYSEMEKMTTELNEGGK